MKRPFTFRRYLVRFDPRKTPHVFTDVLVLGSGIAGLSVALAASSRCSVLVVTKSGVREGNTNAAQGGVASALAPGDSPQAHYEDTLRVGCGLCNEDNVRILTEEGPQRIADLLAAGMAFDQKDSQLSFGKEAGHRTARILHANGDATGAALEQALTTRVRANDSIEVVEKTFAIDLLTDGGTCHGALIWSPTQGLMLARAKQTILATGGCGRVFRETTNPTVATGDGFAMAFRSGAELQDLEFVQFHPTTLYVAGASRALISESLRGDGGILVNRFGERFMPRYHPDAELAPRDVVSRSIIQEMRRTNYTHVYLDARSKSRQYMQKRFPTITKLCDEFGLNVAKDLIPVRPAAHYMVGGVKVDQDGRTNVRNLFACGEVACTGIHGANRLGSNSLLEGLVFGHRAGTQAARKAEQMKEQLPFHAVPGALEEPVYGHLNLSDVENSLRSIMWRNVGLEREERGLAEAVDTIDFWCRYVMDKEFDHPQGWQLQNMLTLARLIAQCARERRESRGVHYRTDFPETSPHWRYHTTVSNKK